MQYFFGISVHSDTISKKEIDMFRHNLKQKKHSNEYRMSAFLWFIILFFKLKLNMLIDKHFVNNLSLLI